MAANAADIVEIENYIQQVKKLVPYAEYNQELQRHLAAKVGDSSMTALHGLMEQHNRELQNLKAAVAAAESLTRDIDKVFEDIDKVHAGLDKVYQEMIRPIARTLIKLARKISQYLFEAFEKKCIPMLNSLPEEKRKEHVGMINAAKRDRQIYLESRPIADDDEAKGGNTTAEMVDDFKKMKIEAEVVQLFSRL